MADELGDQQEHIEYLELRRVWKSIGLTLTNDVLQEWRTRYPVNIAVLDSGVKEDIQAFQSKPDLPKVLNSKSFVAAENDAIDVLGHGTFCAGVAAGYPIPSPKKVKDYKVQKLAEIFSNLQQLPDGSRKAVEDIFDVLSGGDLEDFPFVGVAPFANIISYKVIDDNDMLNEEALACALRDLVEHNSKVEFKEKIHIVSMSLSAHYHDGVRRALYDVLNDDMIVVAAACNMGQKNNYCSGNIWFPARFGNVISVGSHDNHGQPSKISSVGREVDFIAPGEEIWGPSICEENKEPSTSAEKEYMYSSFIEKDEGTSVSAAIVSGIVALVLAFVHKEKGADVRAKISNNPVMKEILGNMATKRGQHDKIEGYGSLKPLKVFGYGGHILWSLIENLPGITENCNINGNVRVSNFMLSETALAMHFLQERREIKNKYIFHDKLVSSIQSVLDALDHLSKRQFASHVDVIDLRMPPLLPNNGLDQVSKLLLCKNVLPIIENSEIKVIEQLFFPSSEFIIMGDFCMFMNKLSKSILSGLKIVVMPVRTYVDVLYHVAQILSTARLPDVQEPVYIFVSYPMCTGDFETPDSDMSERVKVISTCPFEMELGSSARRYPWMNLVRFEVYFQHLVQMSRNAMMNSRGYSKASDQLLSVDDLALLSIELKSIPPTPRFITAYKCIPSVPALAKVTVAILGDAINIHQNEIYHKINQVSNLKSFTIPSGGIVEKGRHLGTLCASVIAGKSEGIAPFVDLVYATVMNAEAKTKPEWVISALKWIEREHSDVDIVLIPLGFDKFNLGLFQIINRLSKNMVIVCAANNSREAFKPGICFPARYGDVICVGSHSTSSQPSSFSPQGREIDLLALGEAFTFQNYSVGDGSERARALSYTLTMIHKAYVVSGTCVAAACAAGVIAQIVAFALHCGFERQQITNNTVVRELLKHLTCNFSHDPHSGHGWVKNLSESELFKSPEYFKKIVEEILSIDDGNGDDYGGGDG